MDDNRSEKIIDAKSKKIASCLPAILLQIKWYSVTVTTVITESKVDLKLLLPRQTGELQVTTVIAVEIWRRYEFDMIKCRININYLLKLS